VAVPEGACPEILSVGPNIFPDVPGRNGANRPFYQAISSYTAKGRMWSEEYLAHLVDKVLPSLAGAGSADSPRRMDTRYAGDAL